MALQLTTLKALRTLDLNHDRRITLQELQKADKNNDQQISAAEAQDLGFSTRDLLELNSRLKKGLEHPSAVILNVLMNADEMRAQEFVGKIDNYFDQIDSDRDGYMSGSEVKKAFGNPRFNATEASAVVSCLNQSFTALRAFSDDQTYLPKLPNLSVLNKVELLNRFPLHGFDEKGISRADLDAFITVAAKNPSDARVSKAMGEFSMMEFGSDYGEKRLFPKGIESIRPDNVAQGQIGDCYFLAAVAALADTPKGKQQIKDMIKENQDGTFTVTFPDSKPVTFAPLTPNEKNMYSSAGSDGTWLSIIEKAYALKSNRDSIPNRILPRSNPYDAIGSGGLLSSGVSTMTGKSTDTDILLLTSEESLRTKLQQALKQGNITTTAITGSLNPFGDHRTGNGLPQGHAYSVLGFDPKTNEIKIRNPWGNTEVTDSQGRPRDGRDDGVFTLSLKEYRSTFALITYASN